jgi:hypothetical protein
LTADEIDPKQLKDQIALKQQIQGNKNLPKFMEGKGLIIDDFTKKVNLPYTQDLELQIPPFLIRKNNKKRGYNYKLVNPLTQERTLSKRGNKLNVGVARRIIPKPKLAVYEAEHPQPLLSDFAPKDRALLEKYDGLIENYIDEFKDKDYQSIPEVTYKNETRGLPCKLPANCSKKGHQKGKKQYRGYDNIDGDETEKISIKELKKKVGKRGRPKKVVSVTNAVAIEDIPEVQDDEPNIEFDIQEEEEEPKKRGRKPKYATKEEAREAKKQQTLISNKRQKEKQKAERQMMSMEDKKGEGLAEKNNISSNTKMPNKWIEHCKSFAKKNGMKYSEALKDPKCKATYGKGMKGDSDSEGDVNIDIDVGENHTNRKGKYKMGGASPFTTQPGKITPQNNRYVSVRSVGFGLDGGRQNDKQEAVIYNESQLGANAGKKFISL